jgi:predicted ribosome quality control (RQC) complex YloA/Tae2 family protein
MLKRAKKYAKQIGADYIFTGEVLGQRPMSQHKAALKLIEKEAGLEGKILRPLSGKLLPKTEAEEKGYIKKEALKDISGRSRKPQIQMTKEFNISKYPCAGGGCLLTDKQFAAKLYDLFQHKKRVTIEEVKGLKIGRHFRFGDNKIIVGRNETENRILAQTKNKTDYLFEVPNCGSPTTILRGPKTKKAIQQAARITAFHSDQKNKATANVSYGQNLLDKKITVPLPAILEIDALRI